MQMKIARLYEEFYKIIAEDNLSNLEIIAFLSAMTATILDEEIHKGDMSKKNINEKIDFVEGYASTISMLIGRIIYKIRKENGH